MQQSPKLYKNTVQLLGGCLLDLLECNNAHPKSISCYQDYIKVYLCPRITEDVRNRLWGDEIFAYALNIEPPKEQKYNANQQTIVDYLTQKREQWWTSIDKQWLVNTGKKIPVQRHIERQAWNKFAPLLLPEDVVTYINDFI